MSADGTWDVVLARLLSAAEAAGVIDWAVAVDSTIARAHQHATNVTRHTGGLGRITRIRASSRLTTALAAPAAA
jgi:putative transposase